MSKCKYCKWWGGASDMVVPECVPHKAILEFKICKSDKFIYGGQSSTEGPPVTLDACVYDDCRAEDETSADSGEVITGPDFGCIHFEVKA